jgi:hypothetical protein
MGSRPVVFKTQWWMLSNQPVAPPRGALSMSSSNLVVDAVGSTGNTPQGGPAIDVVFKTRWWMLPDPPVAPLRGPAIDVFFKLGGGLYQTH